MIGADGDAATVDDEGRSVMGARLYGRAVGNGSHAVVTRGFKTALEDAGLLEGFLPVDQREEEDAPVPGALAHHGVYTGPLNWLPQMSMNTRHKQKWAVVAPNSNHIPLDIVKSLHEAKAKCLVPSMWAAEQLIHYDLPAMVVPHGVQGFDTVERSAVHEMHAQERFQVLHLSSSAGQRKGTDLLIQAWLYALSERKIPKGSVLLCVLDNDAMQSLKMRLMDEEILIPESVRLVPRGDLSAVQMAALFANAHVLCQPSRAEAFGLCPLEALACGVPVVASICSGHSYLYGMAGVMPVWHDDVVAPIDDGPGAYAPAIPFSEIAMALASSWHSWENLEAQAQANAAAVREEWSWKRQLAGWITKLSK